MTEMLYMENVRIIFKNFSGKEGPYNEEGVRSFNAIIEDPDLANRLMEDGWNVKPLKNDDPTAEQEWTLPVAVSYKKIPPLVEMLMGDRKVSLTEDNVGELDYHRILSADVFIAPSVYTSRITGRDQVKAYLRSMAVNVELDPIAAKYANYGK